MKDPIVYTMPIVSGLSVGDFISGINLIRDFTKALEDSAGFSAEYLGLIRELCTVGRALLEVKHVGYNALHQTKALPCGKR